MLSKDALDFLLKITDYFHGHYEDLGWGRLPSSQRLVAIAIRELATGIHDNEFRVQIHTAADKIIAKNSQLIEKI